MRNGGPTRTTQAQLPWLGLRFRHRQLHLAVPRVVCFDRQRGMRSLRGAGHELVDLYAAVVLSGHILLKRAKQAHHVWRTARHVVPLASLVAATAQNLWSARTEQRV